MSAWNETIQNMNEERTGSRSEEPIRLHVYRLPAQLSNGYCFGDGVPIVFQNVDWFDAPPMNDRDVLVRFVKSKRYYNKALRFLVLSSDPAWTFVIEPEAS